MIYSQKEQKRRKRFRTVVIILVAAILICIGALIIGYLYTRSQVIESSACVNEVASLLATV